MTMDLSEVGEQIAESVVNQLARIDERQAEQRERWYRDEDGKKEEVVQTFTIAGRDYEFPMIGIERPSRLDIKEIEVKLNTDTSLQNRKGVCRFIARAFAGSDTRSSEFDVRVKFKQSAPSEGILALHKNAANRIKEMLQQVEVEESVGKVVE